MGAINEKPGGTKDQNSKSEFRNSRHKVPTPPSGFPVSKQIQMFKCSNVQNKSLLLVEEMSVFSI
jgi:hypothetical protein